MKFLNKTLAAIALMFVIGASCMFAIPSPDQVKTGKAMKMVSAYPSAVVAVMVGLPNKVPTTSYQEDTNTKINRSTLLLYRSRNMPVRGYPLLT